MTRFRSATRRQVIEPANCSGLSQPLALTAMGLGWGLVQLDVSIVNTALESIGTSLGGGVSELQWVVSIYTVAFASLILTTGALGESLRCEKNFHDWLCPIHGRFADFWTGADIRNPDCSPRSTGRWRGDHGAKLAGAAQPRLYRTQSSRPRRRLVSGGWRRCAYCRAASGRRTDCVGRMAEHLSRQPGDRPCGPVADLGICHRYAASEP